VGWFIVLAGVGISLYQIGLWLRDGYWTPLEFKLIFDKEPDLQQVTWIGVQKILAWILGSPLSVGLMVVGLLVVWWGSRNHTIWAG
jgi:hypothetical protein